MWNNDTESKLVFSQYLASLSNGESIQSDWIDTHNIDKIQFSGYASATGMTMTIDSKANNTTAPTQLSTPVTYSDGIFYMFNVICRQRWMRFTWANNTGGTVTNVSMELKGSFGGSDKLSVFPVGVNPTDFSQAALVQSISRGQQPDGDYVAIPADGTAFSTTSTLTASSVYTSSWIDSDGYNEIDITIETDQLSASRGIQIEFTNDAQAGSPTTIYSRYYEYRQEDIDRGYLRIKIAPSLDGFRITYTNGATDQTEFLLQADLRANGDPKLLNDGGATVISDFGVEVLRGGIPNYNITTVFGRNSDIDTTSTPEDITEIGGVYAGQPTSFTPELVTISSSNANDTSAGTGARTVRVFGLKSNTSEIYETEDITLSGGTLVDSVNTWWRINEVEVLTAGSNGSNQGIITVAAKTTTSVIFAKVPVGYNHSQIAAYTVPANKNAIVKRMRINITRVNGSAGSATVCFYARKTNQVYQCVAPFELQTGGVLNFTYEGGKLLPAGTDVKFGCTFVSDNNTVVDCAFELYTINT